MSQPAQSQYGRPGQPQYGHPPGGYASQGPPAQQGPGRYYPQGPQGQLDPRDSLALSLIKKTQTHVHLNLKTHPKTGPFPSHTPTHPAPRSHNNPNTLPTIFATVLPRGTHPLNHPQTRSTTAQYQPTITPKN